MAGKPKENALVVCHCPKCNGKLTDPVAYMQHTGKVSSGMAEYERIFYMGVYWRKEEG